MTTVTLADWNVLPWSSAATGHAHRVDILMAYLTGFNVLIVLVVGVLVAWYCLRYRAGSRAPRPPVHGRGSTRNRIIEIGLLTSMLVVFLGMGAWAGVVYYRGETIPADAEPIYVVGKQWMWKIEHPSGRREINELHIPAGQTIRLIMASQDVIHSFYVPAFRLKQDVVPGHYSSEWFKPTQTGVFHLFCAEYCGTEHSSMRGRIIVMPPDEYERWLADEADIPKTPGMPGTNEAPLRLGQGLFFRLGCGDCHMRSAQGSITAPRLDGIWGRLTKLNNDRLVLVDENYIRESILDPNAKIVAGYPQPSLMPSFRGQVSEEDLINLVEFIRSIRYGWPKEFGTPDAPPVRGAPPNPGSNTAVPSGSADPTPPTNPARVPPTDTGPSRTEANP